MGELTAGEEELIHLFITMGISKNVARTLICLAAAGEATSPEIENAARLRQPEVSIAIQELRDRNWVAKRDLSRQSKGRPVHSYRLEMDFTDILHAVEKQEMDRIRKMEHGLMRLKALAGKAEKTQRTVPGKVARKKQIIAIKNSGSNDGPKEPALPKKKKISAQPAPASGKRKSSVKSVSDDQTVEEHSGGENAGPKRNAPAQTSGEQTEDWPDPKDQ